MTARLRGLAARYAEVHTWIPVPRDTTAVEAALGEILFDADSALECMVFGLNALGHGVRGRGFRNTMSRGQLKSISPRDPIRADMDGWPELFPRFSDTLRASWGDIVTPIMEQHDVAKHRTVVFRGGTLRDDTPSGFWERLGLTEERDPSRFVFMPYSEILLLPDPKRPRAEGDTTKLRRRTQARGVDTRVRRLDEQPGEGSARGRRSWRPPQRERRRGVATDAPPNGACRAF